MAAHALRLHGITPKILSAKQKSQMHGAIYLHELPPELNDVRETVIAVRKEGTKEGYAEKVYGDPTAQVSWEQFFDGNHIGWSLQDAYDQLWDKYEHLIHQVEFKKHIEPIRYVADFDTIISSIPAPALCRHGHVFNARNIWVSVSDGYTQEDTIVYNGEPHISWYRSSLLFGTAAVESVEPWYGSVEGIKPLSNNCDCNPRFHRIGRFGKWEKKVLSHEAFKETIQIAIKEGYITDALF